MNWTSTSMGNFRYSGGVRCVNGALDDYVQAVLDRINALHTYCPCSAIKPIRRLSQQGHIPYLPHHEFVHILREKSAAEVPAILPNTEPDIRPVPPG